MNRARFVLAATLAGSSLVGVSVFAQTPPPAQTPPAPEMKSVLAGKKFTPPVKGDAQIDYVKTPTKREGTTLVTKIMDDYETHDDRRLLPGTGFTIEPGLYFDDFGVRTEINMIVAARDAAVTGPLQTELVRLV